MELIRLNTSTIFPDMEEDRAHRQAEFGTKKIPDSYEPKVRVQFSRFGRGEERRSNFAVEISWIDVQGLLRDFIEMGHHDALYLQRVIRLSDMIEDAGWHPSDPPSQDLRDGFLNEVVAP